MENETEKELIGQLSLVLDFVERWNKMDAEKDVAVAAELLRDRFGIFHD